MSDSSRLYYSDAFLQSFEATVTAVRNLSHGAGGPFSQVALNRTAFYPTSGGQPFDTGLLSFPSSGGTLVEVPVDQVEEDEAGVVWHSVRHPLSEGARVTGTIDWERRFDHMQQHSGQHLLSAVFARELHAHTVSFHLGESISTIDLATGPLAHHSIERVERMVNQIIAEDRSMKPRSVARAEAESLLASGELRKLPEREGTIRLVEIADLDLNACGGTHVRSTGQIGGLLLRKIENVSRGVRVEFVCGLRAVRAARTDATVLSESAGLLSTAQAELPESIKRLLAEQKTLSKERQKLREELAGFQAAQLVAETPGKDGLRLVVRDWKDRDRDSVRLLASRTAAAAPATAVVFAVRDGDMVRVFMARSADLVFNCGQILRQALADLGLRGGGSADLAQGDVPLAQADALRVALVEAVRLAASSS